jgi:hypothetical protein
MYEVTLGTSGIQQLGWATFDCRFTHEEGVGDSQVPPPSRQQASAFCPLGSCLLGPPPPRARALPPRAAASHRRALSPMWAQFSYAYDGKRVKKWNIGSASYGQVPITPTTIHCCNP